MGLADVDPFSRVRFWLNVAPGLSDDECWKWCGAMSKRGYGVFWLNGSLHPAHRIAYQLEEGPIDDTADLHHECEVKICVNPRHLKPLTRKEHAREHGPVGIAAVHAAALTCSNGHPFDGHNGVQRLCSICRKVNARERQRRYRARRVAA